MEPPNRRRWHFGAATVLLGALGALAALGVAELAARTLDPVTPSEKSELDALAYEAWSLGPCYRVSGSRLVRVTPPNEPQDPAADPSAEFPLARTPGVRRIAVVGESTGEMLEKTMADLVRRGACQQPVEILKCGVFGGHPSQIVSRVREVLDYSPDEVVVALGHNFLLNQPPKLAELPNLWVNHLRLARELYKLLPPKESARTAPEPLDTGGPPSQGREAYRAILQLTHARSVGVVAVLLASNLWWPPNPEDGYVESADRARAWAAWARGDLGEAMGALAAPPAGDGSYRAFERALFRAEAGDWPQARRDLESARDLERQSTRASATTTAAIAQEAAAGGATLIDVDKLFTPIGSHGLPGWDVFIDNCHPNTPGMILLSESVLHATAPGASCSAAAAPVALGVAPIGYDALLDSPYKVLLPDPSQAADWNRNAADPSARRLLANPILNLLRNSPNDTLAILQRYDREVLQARGAEVRGAVLRGTGEITRDAGRLDVARWCLEESAASAPSALTRIELAAVHLRAHDEARARDDLERAKQLDPSSPIVRNAVAAFARPGPAQAGQ